MNNNEISGAVVDSAMKVLSYLKLSGKPIGLLINFHSLHLRDGIKRFVI